MEIKVCGLKFLDNIKEVAKFKINYLGFVCFAGSKRYVDIEKWEELAFGINDKNIAKVMVCVNPTLDYIENYFKVTKFDYIQLHGNEDANFCKEVKNIFKVKIIKAFSVDNVFDFDLCSVYQHYCDLFIFDTKCESFGGSGKMFNWDLLDKYKLSTNYLLSGGLNPENIELAFKRVNSLKASIGLDVNSGFESKPGYKDIKKLEVLFNEKENYGF